MTSSLLLPIAAFVLAAVSVGGVLFALFQPRFAGGSPLDRRVEAIAGPRVATVRVAEGAAEKARKRSVKSTLREAEERQKGSERRKYKPSLAIRLRQADLSWNLRTYRLVSAGVGGALFLAWLAVVGPMAAAVLGMAGGLLLPRLYVGFRRRRRLERFRSLFPDAIDVIVRGLLYSARLRRWTTGAPGSGWSLASRSSSATA
jgi:tight adherence protein B